MASKNFTDSAGAPSDVHGHGTHTASTVGGSGAASDGAKKGVAPETQLLIGKVLSDNGGGSDSMIIAGMEWAVAQGADVVSMSLGSHGAPAACNDPMSSAAEELATTSATLFVIAAGNTGPANNTVSSPGCAPGVLTVGAVDRDDVPASFSSRGPTAVDHTLKPEIAAPGVGISAARRAGAASTRTRHVRHVDGDPARRGRRRHRQAAPPRLDRAADQGRPRLLREVRRSR